MKGPTRDVMKYSKSKVPEIEKVGLDGVKTLESYVKKKLRRHILKFMSESWSGGLPSAVFGPPLLRNRSSTGFAARVIRNSREMR